MGHATARQCSFLLSYPQISKILYSNMYQIAFVINMSLEIVRIYLMSYNMLDVLHSTSHHLVVFVILEIPY